MSKFVKSLAGAALIGAIAAHAGPVVVDSTNATLLANTIAGSGITISNATLAYNGTTLPEAPSGTFTGGTASVGFDAGIVLTNGSTRCASGTNTQGNCTYARGGNEGNNIFDRTSLSFDFTSTTGQVFFQYVFASEEYNEFVNAGFNDQFELLLNGVNIAKVPGSGDVVSIDNVNCNKNSSFYRNNSTGCAAQPSLGLSIQYDGLTAVLTASGTVGAGVNNFKFTIFDRGDDILDSGVFIKAGSFSSTDPGNPVPEPASLALVGLALAGVAAARRKRA